MSVEARIDRLRQLQDRIVSEFNELGLYPRKSPVDIYLVGFATRALHLNLAVLTLVDDGFMAEAKILTRALCEIWILVRWLTNKDSEKRFARYAKFEAKLIVSIPEILGKHSPSLTINRRSDHDFLAQAAEEFTSHRKWAKTDLKAMAEERDTFENSPSGSPADATWHYDLPYMWHSGYVHSNCFSLREVCPQWGEPVDFRGIGSEYGRGPEEPLLFSSGYDNFGLSQSTMIWTDSLKSGRVLLLMTQPGQNEPLDRQLKRLAGENYLYLTTTGRKSGKARTVELWFVVFESKFYMVSGDPAKTDWVRNLQQNPRVHVHINSTEIDGAARMLDRSEQPLWDTVSRMACEKYREPEPWGTPIEITPIELP